MVDQQGLKHLVMVCNVIVFMLGIIVIVAAIKGEKRLVQEGYIRRFLLWSEAKGDDVPARARIYKIIAITFACVMMFVSAILTIAILALI